MLVNKVVNEGFSLMNRIKNSPELMEKAVQHAEKSAKFFEKRGDSFSKSIEKMDSPQFKEGTNKIQELIESIPPSVEEKIGSIMENFETTVSETFKNPADTMANLPALLKPRTEIKRALRNDPEAQAYLKKLVAAFGDSDIKKVVDHVNQTMNYKNAFGVNTINKYAKIISPKIPGYKELVIKAEPMLDKPVGERIQEFISYFIKQ